MKSITLLLLGLFVVGVASNLEVSAYTWDFGSIPKMAYAHHTFTIKNTGTQPVRILKMRRFCGCLIYTLPDTIIYPNATTSLNVGYFSGTKSTNEQNRIYMTTDDPVTEILKFTITAQVGKDTSGFRIEPRRIKVADLEGGSLRVFNDTDSLARLKLVEATSGIEIKAETTVIEAKKSVKIEYKSKYRVFNEKPSVVIDLNTYRMTIPIDVK